MNLRYFSLFILVIASIATTSCSSTLRLSVLKPAAVTMHQDIKSIALVNRTKPKNKASNIIEGIFSGEALFQDKSGIEQALGGLMNVLQNSPRYTVVMTNKYLQGSGAGNVFPPPLSWEEVASICKEFNTDVVCTIETYDSDTRVVTTRNVTTRRGNDGKNYTVEEFIANQTVRVQVGFRVYDPVDKNIIDQFHFTEQNVWTSRGANELQAVSGLINRAAASNQVSNTAGGKYGVRISPSWTWVTRSFYTKGGHEKMKTAARFARANKWIDARGVWMDLLTEKRKTAGKAAHNIAISYEWEGNLLEAKEWASKAYTSFGNKRGRDYVNILNGRMREISILENQMRGAQ